MVCGLWYTAVLLLLLLLLLFFIITECYSKTFSKLNAEISQIK